MTSAASELLQLITDWATLPRDTELLKHRDTGAGWWANHTRAIELTNTVERQAREIAGTRQALAKALPVFDDIKALIFPSVRYVRGQAIELIPETSIATFAAMVAALEANTPDPDTKEALEVLETLTKLITSLNLPAPHSDYLTSLCEQIKDTLQNYSTDTSDTLTARIFKLFTVLNLVTIDSEQRNKISEHTNRLFKLVARIIFIDAPVNIATSIVSNQVTELLALKN